MPVEIGVNYLASDCAQRLMTISDFIDEYILGIDSVNDEAVEEETDALDIYQALGDEKGDGESGESENYDFVGSDVVHHKRKTPCPSSSSSRAVTTGNGYKSASSPPRARTRVVVQCCHNIL